MNILKLSSLIGQEIAEVRFHYVPEDEYGLQSFYAFLRLTDETILTIPKFSDDDDYLELTPDNVSYLKRMFDTGDLVGKQVKKCLVGQKIVDFYFCYYHGEVDIDISAFIKLTNGYYLSENNDGPIGVNNVDLILLTESEFLEKVKKLNEFGVTIRSFSEMSRLDNNKN